MQTETTNASLSPGTLIGRYEIREILGIGGFGITYKAWDTKLNRLVAIKEYLPAETAVRVQGSSQINAYQSRSDEYQYGLERFLDEAKTLAKFQHPNIIGVLDHLELNNTAYLIMNYEQGQTLSQQLKQRGGKLPEPELKAITKAILTGLQHIHEQDYYHRDIKPGNIYLRKQGEPVLIDFGAARQAIGARSRSLTNIVSAGYAPNEQYASNQRKQGPWTDLYAVGATLYRSISGQQPVDAPTRSSDMMEGDPDPLIPATKIAQGHYSQELLQLIDWMMAPAIKNRPHNVTQILSRLEQPAELVRQSSTEVSDPLEARSTLATKLVSAADYPQKEQQSSPAKVALQDREKVVASKPKKSRRGFILLCLGIILLAGLGVNREYLLPTTETIPDKTEMPHQAAVNTNSQTVESQKRSDRQNGIDMIWIDPGCFQMGSTEGESDEKPVHRVCLSKGYYLGKYEVTQAQWQSVMGSNPSDFKCQLCPVESVSWNDVQDFIRKLNRQSGLQYRLPTEAEWEYAARAGATTAFSFGNNITTKQVNYHGKYPYKGATKGEYRKKTVTVGSLPANAWGLHEMQGNVWELVADWYSSDYYQQSSRDDPKGPSGGSRRVSRGGSWLFYATHARSAYRGHTIPGDRGNFLGFRLARTNN